MLDKPICRVLRIIVRSNGLGATTEIITGTTTIVEGMRAIFLEITSH
jgi:hypothetical protein